MGINVAKPPQAIISAKTIFSWAPNNCIIYLGIQIATPMSCTLTLNYWSLVDKLVTLSKSFDKPYNSLAGRNAASKILLLPHILYMLFRTIPSRLSLAYLHNVQGLINRYVWRN